MTHPELVIDTSIAASWVLDDEMAQASTSALAIALAGKAHVPALFYYEVVNALTMARQRHRIAYNLVEDRLESILALPLNTMPVDFRQLAKLSEKYKLTSYDASYLYLAETLNIALATFDKDLAKAASQAGIHILT